MVQGVIRLICHIKTIITYLEMTQDELAESLQVNRNTITNIATNKTVPNLKLAYQIVDIFNTRAKLRGIEKQWRVEDVWER